MSEEERKHMREMAEAVGEAIGSSAASLLQHCVSARSAMRDLLKQLRDSGWHKESSGEGEPA